jgi:L-alanine-DL-glutamate epimerase-like enolase superfamily enzyme
VSTFDLVADLPVEVDGYELEGLHRNVSSGFERHTTLVHLRGGGEEGVGEDVVYDTVDQLALQEAGQVHDLAGRWTLGDLCARLDDLDLFGVEPQREVSRRYRRWTFHSAALDLALRQAGRPLYEVLGRDAVPVTFVVSLRLGEPASLAPVTDRLARYPTLRFKLDPTSDWDDDIVAGLVETGAVDSVDFKSFYKGTVVDQPTDVALYRRVIEAFPDAWIEDADVETAETRELLEPHRDRLTWDAPIHSIDDIEALRWKPRMVNVKPSRIGRLQDVLDAYDYCAREGIGVYGGGQFELGPGRGHIQYNASLFHPDTPNDIAPTGYNEVEPADGLPASPLAPLAAPTGFRWG